VMPVDEQDEHGVVDWGDGLSATPTTVDEMIAFKVMGSSGTYPGSDYINFGTLAYGGSESAQQSIEISNTGNVGLDSQLYAANDADPNNMSCTVGKVSIGYINLSLNNGFSWYAYGTDDAVNGVYYLRNYSGPNFLDDLNLGVTTETQDSTSTLNKTNTYWKMKMPDDFYSGTISGGTCSDSIVFEAWEDAG